MNIDDDLYGPIQTDIFRPIETEHPDWLPDLRYFTSKMMVSLRVPMAFLLGPEAA